MKAVIQRVSSAKVESKNKLLGNINNGYLILLAVSKNDTQKDLDYLVKKIVALRIMSDKNHKMNLSIKEVNGEVLVVSQFTLFANTKKGNRPSFINAAPPQKAKKLYLDFISQIKNQNISVKKGEFAAHMQVSLVNDGPVTIIIDTQAKSC